MQRESTSRTTCRTARRGGAWLAAFALTTALSTGATLRQDLVNPELTMIDVVQRALQSGTDIGTVVTESLATRPDKASTVLGAAIAVSPGAIDTIVETALRLGTEEETVAQQCRTALTTSEISQVIVTSMRERARPEPIISTCILMIPQAEVPPMVREALANAPTEMHQRIITAAFGSLGEDPDTIVLVSDDLVSALAEGTLESPLTEDDITAFATGIDDGPAPPSTPADAAEFLERDDLEEPPSSNS